MSENSRLVYSTDSDNTCITCKKPVRKCTCKKERSKLSSKTALKIYFEKKGRKGSGVTVISGLLLNKKELRNVAANLKKHCGVGGSVKNNDNIELQGDQRIKTENYISTHELLQNL